MFLEFKQIINISNVSRISQHFQKELALLSAFPLGDLSSQHFYRGFFHPTPNGLGLKRANKQRYFRVSCLHGTFLALHHVSSTWSTNVVPDIMCKKLLLYCPSAIFNTVLRSRLSASQGCEEFASITRERSPTWELNLAVTYQTGTDEK